MSYDSSTPTSLPAMPAAAPTLSHLQVMIVRDISALPSFCDDWNGLRRLSPGRTAVLEDYARACTTAGPADPTRLVVVKSEGQVTLLAPFRLIETHRRYTLGQRCLLRLPVRCLRLTGSSFLGTCTSEQIRRVFDALRNLRDFHVIETGELECDGPLHRALLRAIDGTNWKSMNPWYKSGTRYLIDLPNDFDIYLASLSHKRRAHVRRILRILDKNYGGQVRVVSNEADVTWFLSEGESISRKTYQWHIGQRLCNDDSTRRAYCSLARAGRLRCYVMYAQGQPCAFARGTITDAIYDYQTPGFDPAFAKASPGKVLLMKVVKDLIENTECQVLDFGGGDDEYKRVFGNRCYRTVCLDMWRKWDMYPATLMGIGFALKLAKGAGSTILGDGALERRIKRALRR